LITLGKAFSSAATSGLPLEVSMDNAATAHKHGYGMLEGVVAERYLEISETIIGGRLQ
jgi:hypothetical protein